MKKKTGIVIHIRVAILCLVAAFAVGTIPPAWAYIGTGEGMPSNPYKIATCEQLQHINDNRSASFILTGDIDCSETSTWNGGAGFDPIGNNPAGFFTGTLDGQNFAIKNLYINNQDTASYTGLFGYVAGATITRLRLEGGTVTQTPASSLYMGSLAALADGATISHVSSNVTTEGQYGGGLLGYVSGGSLTSSSVTGTTTMSGYRYTGGITGLTVNTTLSDLYTTGTIGARGGIAGVIGTGTTLTNVYSTAAVSYGDTDAAGGLFGSIDGVSDPTSASNIFFDGTVSGPSASYVGGVVGSLEGGATIAGAYYNIAGCGCSAGVGTSSGGSGTATGVNSGNADPNYFKGNSTNTPMSSWNFSTIWQTNIGAYPTFRATSTPSDGDGDGISDAIEAAGPNNGDADNDGIPDTAETNTTSFVNPLNGQYISLHSTCDSHSGVSSSSEAANAHSDTLFSYPLGLTGFTLHCTTVGQTATVTLYYYYVSDPGTLVARKYNATSGTYQAVDGATVTKMTVGGKTAVRVTYSIIDGGTLDQDGVADGTIIDPVGLALAPVTAPNTGLGGTAR